MNNEGIVVLSLFDGMSCGQIALQKLGIKVKQYYACEIDKYAMSVTQANFPNTIQLGDVRFIDVSKLPKIDLLIGGSPCQSFSFAGKQNGMSTKDSIEILTIEHYLELKEQKFEFEGQSYLFWEYMRIKKEADPTNFLLENVMMSDKWKRVLTQAIGIKPICINSSLVSAQNRERLYWTNIGAEADGLFGDLACKIPQPKDKGILLRDILEEEVDERYYLSEKALKMLGDVMIDKSVNKEKSMTIDSSYYKGVGIRCNDCRQIVVHNMMPRSRVGDPAKGGTGHLTKSDGKTYCLDTGNTNAVEIKNINRQIITHNVPEMVSVRKHEVDVLKLQSCLKEHKKTSIKALAAELDVPKTMVEHWFRTDDCFSIPDKDIWLKLKQVLQIETDEFDLPIMEFEEKESVFEKTNRVYDQDGLAPTLTSTGADERIMVNSRIRRLTPIECERLQCVKDNYTNHVSSTQRYRMLGNGWTIDVISHILSYLK